MIAGLGIGALGDQGHLAIVVDEADPGKALVRHAGAQLHRMEVAKRDGPLRERAVERDQQRFVLGPDGTEDETSSVRARSRR